jgi:hypothetical protein
VDILADGSLDGDEESWPARRRGRQRPHPAQETRDQMTARVVRAIENPHATSSGTRRAGCSAGASRSRSTWKP